MERRIRTKPEKRDRRKAGNGPGARLSDSARRPPARSHAFALVRTGRTFGKRPSAGFFRRAQYRRRENPPGRQRIARVAGGEEFVRTRWSGRMDVTSRKFGARSSTGETSKKRFSAAMPLPPSSIFSNRPSTSTVRESIVAIMPERPWAQPFAKRKFIRRYRKFTRASFPTRNGKIFQLSFSFQRPNSYATPFPR